MNSVRYSVVSPKNWAWVLIIALSASMLTCTLKGNIEDISNAQLAFTQPADSLYINQTNYDFKVMVNSANIDINADSAVMEIYESMDCDRSKLIETNSFASASGMVGVSGVASLQDGKRYSARVVIKNKDKTFQSECSSWVGVDLQKPNSVAVSYPPANTYVSSKEFTTVWSAATDNGIAGLSETPYRLRLYGQPACAGPVLQQADAAEEQYKFKKLTQGVTYSVQVSAVDKAGNESVLTCSPYTEIDVYAPGFKFEDPTSVEGYSRVTSPNVYFTNDATAAYWCLTTDLAFVPTSYTDTCPGGNGSVNGWYNSRPTTEALAGGDGPKSYDLWIVRGDGSLISNRQTSASITLDQTPPGNFTISGIGGVTDPIFDNWLVSSGNPTVKWAASSDATDYTVEIRTLANAVVCSHTGVPATPLEYTFTGCTTLVDGQTYKIRMISYDVARNFVISPDFSFTVDLSAPSGFTIGGVLGGSDTIADGFLGAGLPTIQYGTSTGATHYTVEVKDAAGSSTICTLGDQAAPGGSFNYGTESGVSCAALTHGTSYRVYVTGLNAGGTATAASNNGFTFQVDTVNPDLTIDSQPPALTSDTFANFAFTASDALSGVQTVQCRLDGGAYAGCSSPVSLTGLTEGVHTYDIQAIDMVGNVTTQSASWRVDLSNPMLTILSQPPPYTNTLAISTTFNATDDSGIAGYSCGLDGAALSPCSSPLSFVTTEGPHTLVIRATDNTGFYDEKTETFFCDLTNPILTITSQPPAYTTDPNISIGFTATDAAGIAGYTCTVDGGSSTACTSPFTFTATEGSHSVVVRATDNTGFFDEKTVTFRVDTTNPILTITSQPPAHTTNPNASISFTATDDAGIALYECGIDGAALSVCSSPLTFTAAEGPHSVVVRATDNTGFYDEKTVNFTVDTTAPVLTITSQPPAYTTNHNASFTFSATDADGIAGYTCSIDGGGAGACSSPLTFTAAEGAHIVTIRATDLAGLYDEKTVNFRVDNTNPMLTITSQPSFYTTNPNASISYVATDASGIASVVCSVDGGTAAACASPFTFTASEGAHVVTVKATDNAGLTDTETVNFTVDRVNPIVTLTSTPTNPSHSTTTGVFSFTVTDANPTTTTCQIDGGSFTACSSPKTFTGLASGSHTAVVKATDGAGNTGTASYTWTIYNYSWLAGGWGSCSATQPSWSTGGWGACSVGQPAYSYGGWSACSAPCNSGTQTRSQSCGVVWGTETRSVTCPTNTGTQSRTVQCQRNDGSIVVDTYCNAGTKPGLTQGCSRNDCSGTAPASSTSCSRGGGSDCYGAQATSQGCYVASCYWRSYDTTNSGPACTSFSTCPTYGAYCVYAYAVGKKGKGGTAYERYRCLP